MKVNLPLIKKKRKEKDLSINQMASFLNLSNASQYWKRENGDYNFKPIELPVVSRELEIPFDSLFLSNLYSEIEISNTEDKTIQKRLSNESITSIPHFERSENKCNV